MLLFSCLCALLQFSSQHIKWFINFLYFILFAVLSSFCFYVSKTMYAQQYIKQQQNIDIFSYILRIRFYIVISSFNNNASYKNIYGKIETCACVSTRPRFIFMLKNFDIIEQKRIHIENKYQISTSTYFQLHQYVCEILALLLLLLCVFLLCSLLYTWDIARAIFFHCYECVCFSLCLVSLGVYYERKRTEGFMNLMCVLYISSSSLGLCVCVCLPRVCACRTICAHLTNLTLVLLLILARTHIRLLLCAKNKQTNTYTT